MQKKCLFTLFFKYYHLFLEIWDYFCPDIIFVALIHTTVTNTHLALNATSWWGEEELPEEISNFERKRDLFFIHYIKMNHMLFWFSQKLAHTMTTWKQGEYFHLKVLMKMTKENSPTPSEEQTGLILLH